jgi:AraC-like DNA-binding protein
MEISWTPPFCLHAAGRGKVSDKSYHNDVIRQGGARRILIKHTISGTGTLYSWEKKFILKPGMIFVIERPGPYVYCYEEEPTPWEFEYVSISFTNPGGLLPEKLRKNPVFSLEGQSELKAELRELIDIRNREDYKQELIHSAKAYHFFLSYITQRLKETKYPLPALKLKNFLDDNYKNEISIKELSRELNYSHEALTRLFSKTYGIPPSQYLQDLRLKKASSLLEKGKLSIKEITEQTGFASQSYFARLFKMRLKTTPREYRDNPDPLKFKL